MLSLCLSGEASASINLKEYTFRTNDMLILMPGQIVQRHGESDDFTGCAFAISTDFVKNSLLGIQQFLPVFLRLKDDPCLRLNPDDSPICPPTGMGDLTTGMPLFGAIMTALFARERTGKGDYVSASLYGTGNWVTSAINSGTQYFNPWPRSRFTQSPMGQAFETKDGKFVQIFVNEYERYFPVFCKAFNIEDMLDDERVNTRPALNVNGNCAIIVARCIEEAKKKTADEIMSVLQAGNVPCTVLRGIGDKYKEQEQLDQCLSNGYLGEGTYESGKHYYQPQIPIYMESVGVQNYFAQSKSIGADNDALFAEFSK